MDVFYSIVDYVVSLFQDILNWLSSRLPRSPFADISFTLNTLLDDDAITFLNWLFPISYILQIYASFLFALQLYYCISALLRSAKLID